MEHGGRAWVMVSVMLACNGAVWVELLEEEVAQVVPLGGGPARVVKRTALPPGVREGDVVRQGRVDPEAGARMARKVAEHQARQAAVMPGRLDLDGSPSRPLTPKKER